MSILNPIMISESVQQTNDSHFDALNSARMMEVDALSLRIGMTAVGRQILKDPRLEITLLMWMYRMRRLTIEQRLKIRPLCQIDPQLRQQLVNLESRQYYG